MSAQTPGLQQVHAMLGKMASRYIDVAALPWQPTRFAGIDIKVLMEDPASGLQTLLTRMAPGAVLPDHIHVRIEQSWILEGTLVDQEGTAGAGSFVWRPEGSGHAACAPDGALILGFFLEPNRFL